MIFKVLFRVKVVGRQHLPKSGGFILASNHLSYLDPLILGTVCPCKLNFMARHDLFYNPLFSWLLSKVGAFPIKRNSADISALKEAIRRVKNGGGLLVFPEGSRGTNSTILGEPQPGIGFLIAKLNTPVIPAFISGSEFALPRGARFIRPGKICVYFGKQISLERRKPHQDVAEEVMMGIRQLAC